MTASYVWPSDDGWPYPDEASEMADVAGGVDDDALALRTAAPHLLDGLEPLERQVITARFGIGGAEVRTMKELHEELGLPRADLRAALGTALEKVRAQLSG